MAAIAFNPIRHLPAASVAGARDPAVAARKPQAAFGPIDPDIVSAAIPAFFIGRNGAGFWVAREARGRAGGIFLLRTSAVEFAHAWSRPARCALVFPSEPVELDVENHGSPLIAIFAATCEAARRHIARLFSRQDRKS